MKSYVDVTTPHEWQEHSVTSDKKCSVVDRLFGEVLKICLGQFQGFVILNFYCNRNAIIAIFAIIANNQ